MTEHRNRHFDAAGNCMDPECQACIEQDVHCVKCAGVGTLIPTADGLMCINCLSDDVWPRNEIIFDDDLHVEEMDDDDQDRFWFI
jgi:hypothetical protein